MNQGPRSRSLPMHALAMAMLAFVGTASADPMDDLVEAARKEGQLTVIALPRDWCGYGRIIDGFKEKYGLTVNELRPDAPSADEIDAIVATRHDRGTSTPDVIDVGLSYGKSAKEAGLLQPYKVSTWDTIPASAKDPDGYWYGDYYGVLAFEINADVVRKIPKDWADLAGPEYRGSIGLAGDLASNGAIQGVFAAGLSASGGRVGDAAARGLEFFADLHRKGNIVPFVGSTASLVDGRTPMLIRWDYLALSDRDRYSGKTRIEVVRPKTGIVAGVYVQAISAFAPHPNAARLWMEHLYSDEVQLVMLASRCSPIRLADLARNGKIPVNLRQELPQFDDNAFADPLFPTIEEQERARKIITDGWDGIVGVKIQCFPPENPPSGPTSLRDKVSSLATIP